jgi:hypothetical protein
MGLFQHLRFTPFPTIAKHIFWGHASWRQTHQAAGD